jgi:hypothetical protein
MAPFKAGGLHLDPVIGYVAGVAVAIGLLILCIYKSRR